MSLTQEGKQSVFYLAVNGMEVPPTVLPQQYSSQEEAESSVGSVQQDMEFSPLTVREVKPGETYNLARVA